METYFARELPTSAKRYVLKNTGRSEFFGTQRALTGTGYECQP